MRETAVADVAGAGAARTEGADAGNASWLDGAGTALFRLGRAFGRQATRERLAQPGGHAVALSRILVVQAVERVREESGKDVTIGGIARRLAVDPSTASRLVGEAIDAGFLARVASPTDGRAVCLALTAGGRTLATDARRHQRATFERFTQGWDEGERMMFARLFVRFADAATQVDDDPTT